MHYLDHNPRLQRTRFLSDISRRPVAGADRCVFCKICSPRCRLLIVISDSQDLSTFPRGNPAKIQVTSVPPTTGESVLGHLWTVYTGRARLESQNLWYHLLIPVATYTCNLYILRWTRSVVLAGLFLQKTWIPRISTKYHSRLGANGRLHNEPYESAIRQYSWHASIASNTAGTTVGGEAVRMPSLVQYQRSGIRLFLRIRRVPSIFQSEAIL